MPAQRTAHLLDNLCAERSAPTGRSTISTARSTLDQVIESLTSEARRRPVHQLVQPAQVGLGDVDERVESSAGRITSSWAQVVLGRRLCVTSHFLAPDQHRRSNAARGSTS